MSPRTCGSGVAVHRPVRTVDWRAVPRLIVLLVCLLLSVGCASDASPFVAPSQAGGGPALTADLVPFEASSATFLQRPAGSVVVRTEPTADGARLLIEGVGAPGRRMDLSRVDAAIVFSAGPGRSIELLRLGATPGERWLSGATEVVFDGWERVETGDAVYDAARIRTVGGAGDLRVEDAWWFAPGVGLVRYRQDNAGIFSMEMLRAN